MVMVHGHESSLRNLSAKSFSRILDRLRLTLMPHCSLSEPTADRVSCTLPCSCLVSLPASSMQIDSQNFRNDVSLLFDYVWLNGSVNGSNDIVES